MRRGLWSQLAAFNGVCNFGQLGKGSETQTPGFHSAYRDFECLYRVALSLCLCKLIRQCICASLVYVWIDVAFWSDAGLRTKTGTSSSLYHYRLVKIKRTCNEASWPHQDNERMHEANYPPLLEHPSRLN